ncbi:glycosyltransferase family 2 protein [Roseobacteraceae bacterium S113]
MLFSALSISETLDAPLADVLIAEGWSNPRDISRAQAKRFAAIPLEAADTPADVDCAQLIDPLFCLEHGIWPWMQLGDTLVVATSRPETFESVCALLPDHLGSILMGVATAEDIEAAVGSFCGTAMAYRAESDLPAEVSCRKRHVIATRRQMAAAAFTAAMVAALAFFVPNLFFGLIGAWAVLSLTAIAGMKLVALAARLWPQSVPAHVDLAHREHPTISLLVPLYQETDIAGVLVERLGRLTYPKAKLEALLVLEAEDQQTRAALAAAALPSWMRVITVPPGSLTTKPRALNYARHFAHGDIIGVYDAEDSPAPDQLHVVARAFRDAPKDVVCLQGVLDYYNPRTNWLARCFTIEYAAWFRVLLPGLARVGMPIPLGGTTLFFRRQALDELGGWDAHNVTEDADLGMRLARAGYRTELVDTVTLEEANCRFWPWIRQRSRWLKGYIITYCVHMRRPLQLWRELGAGRFFGFQIFFLASLSQFALAPVMWSFWLVLLGMSHPAVSLLPPTWFVGLATLFLLCELVGLVVGMVAVASPRHRHLMIWVPTLMVYFPLGAVAMYKAMWEFVRRPFFWDKTSHGHSIGRQTIDH